MDPSADEYLLRVERDPADDTAWTALEAAGRASGQLPVLRARLMQLLEQRPARTDLAERLLSIIHTEDDDARAAREALERRLASLIASGAASDLVASAHADVAELWSRVLGRPEHALEHYRAAMAADHRYVRAIYQARTLLRARGELREVDRLLELEALAEPAAARKTALLVELGHLRLRDLDDPARAVEALERAHNLSPDHEVAARELAHALLAQAARDPAVNDAEVRAIVASLFFELALGAPPDIALTYAEEALTALPTHEAALELLELRALELGREDLLPARWVQYLEQAPEGPFAAVRRRRLGRAYIANKQPMDAVRCLEPLAKRGDPEAAELLVEIYRRLGRDDDASSALLAAVAGQSGPARVPKLADVLHLRVDAGRMDEARVVAEEILEIDPAHEVALDLLEAELRREHAFPALKRLYVRAAEAESVHPRLRRRCLLELAALAEGTLLDRELAVRTWETLAASDPVDPLPKSALERLYEGAERWEDLAAHLERSALGVTAPEERARLHHKLAAIYGERLGRTVDAVRALRAYRAVHPEDAEARDRLAELLLATGVTEEAAALLRAKADELPLGPEKAATLERLGQLLEREVEDPSGAFEAYREMLESDAENRRAVESMARLAEARGDWPRLVDALSYALELAAPAERAAILVRMGEVLEHELGDTEGAGQRYAEALVLAPNDASVFEALGRCYGRAERHGDLVAVLRERARRATDASVRVSLHKRTARILGEQLGDVAGAREAWERVLEDDPRNEEALRFALQAARQERAEGATLKRLQELAEVVPTLEERTELVLERATLLAGRLGRGEEAEALVRQHSEHVAPHLPSALDWLRAYYERGSDADREADVLRRLIALPLDAASRGAAARRLADVELHHRRDPRAAEAALATWAAAAPSDPEPTRRLCSLLEREGRWEELRDQLDMLAALETGTAQRQALLRSADVCVTFLRDPDGAFARIGDLAADGDREATAILERIERNESIAPGAADIKLRRASEERDPTRKKALLLDAARLLELHARDRARAFEVTEQAFECDPADERTLALLARRAEAADQTARLADSLRKAQDTLGASLARAQGEAEQVGALTALMRFAWVTLGDEALFESYLARAVGIASAEEALLTRVERTVLGLDTNDAERAAEAFVAALSAESERPGTQPEVGAELLRRAARVLSLRLSAGWEALDVLKRASEMDPAREAILDELEAVCRRVGALRELDTHLAKLAREAIEARPAAMALRRRAGLLTGLGRHGEAAEVLEQLWVLRPSDRTVPEALAQALRRTDRHADLAGVLERMVERADSTEERASLLRELAHTWEFRLDNPWEASRAWQELLKRRPDDAEARAAILRLQDDLHVPTDPELKPRRSPPAR